MKTRTHIFTFFSFKGGVGRSMALLNVAHSLVARGRDVLVVDLDLEAPGIANFLQDNGEVEEHKSADILDLLAWAKSFTENMGERTILSDAVKDDWPPLEMFLTKVSDNKLIASGLGTRSRLDVVGAHLDTKSYLHRLSKLALGSMNRKQLVQMSRILGQIFSSARIPVEIPDYFSTSISTRTKPYDYVLIDSRTGFTEIGGLCVGPLADQVLLFTALNEQNIGGTKRFMETVGLIPVSSAARYHADLRSMNPSEKRKPSLIIASPVPHGELALRDNRLAKMFEGLGPIAAKLSYHPQMALRESNFIRDHPREYLADEYRGLTKIMMEFVGDDADLLEKEIRGLSSVRRSQVEELEDKAIAEGRMRLVETNARYLPLVRSTTPDEGLPQSGDGNINYSDAVSKILRVYAENPSRGESLLEDTLPLLKNEESLLDYVVADHLYAVLTRTNTFQLWRLWANWGSSLRNYAREFKASLDETRFDQLLSAARDKYLKAKFHALREIELAAVLPLLAAVYLDQAKRLSSPASDELFELSRRLLEQVSRIARSVVITRQIGHSYRDEAELHPDSNRADELSALAYAAYERADSDDVFRHDVSTNWSWARALQFQARRKSGEEMHRLFKLAYDKFSTAQRSAPMEAQITAQWGEALLNEAQRTQDPLNAEELLKKARVKLEAGKSAEKAYPELKQAMIDAEHLAELIAERKRNIGA